MGHVSANFVCREKRGFAIGAGVLWVCFMAGLPAEAQVSSSARGAGPASTSRLMNAKEGRSIVNAALEQDGLASEAQDCSHVVHQIYASAGFDYPYASSFDLYVGHENFLRVKIPRPGDLIVWPGHVGIVVDPVEHSFYSLVSTGLEVQDYEAPYWKSRGRPRFYRYRIARAGIVTAARTSTTGRLPNTANQPGAATVVAERFPVENSASNLPLKTVSDRTPAIDAPADPPAPASAAKALDVPSSVIITTGNIAPTRNQVANGISGLSSAAGDVLRTENPLKLRLPVLIVEHFSVERVEFERDRGWAHLQIVSRVSIADGQTHVKQRREKIRWELRRTESGWEAVAPSDRTYVPQDVAVRNLAAQLASLTGSDGAAAHQAAVLRQESQLANLLSALLEGK